MPGLETALRRQDTANVAVFRALQLGDMLCTVPALRALRAALPRARVTLIGLPWARSFVGRFPRYLDDFMPFPGYPGLPERDFDAAAYPRFIEEARGRHFDLAIQMHGSGSVVNRVVESLGAGLNAGFSSSASDHDRPGLYVPWPDQGHEIQRYLRLMEALGFPPRGEALEFPLTPEDDDEFRRLADRESLLSTPYVCLHPGARLRSRRWPPARFAAVGDGLASRGFRLVLTGSSEESGLAAEMERQLRAPCVNLAGRTKLGTVAALIKGARLLVCNDTGVSHIATAVGTPSVVVTLGSEPARWAPLDAARHLTVLHPVDCRPCYTDVCPIGHPCADGVTPSMVLEKADIIVQRRNECVPCAS